PGSSIPAELDAGGARFGGARFRDTLHGKMGRMSDRSSTTQVPQLELNDGNRIPQLGFGVFQVPPEDTAEVVSHALQTGYRSIDTAAAYGNEEGTGESIRASGLPRENVYVTTKLWNAHHGRDAALHAIERSLERLRFEAVDL